MGRQWVAWSRNGLFEFLDEHIKSTMKKLIGLIAGLVLVGIFSSHAWAQEIIAPRPIGFDKMVGLLGVYVPDYEGSDDYDYLLGPLLLYKFSETNRYVQLIGNKLYLNILNHSNLEFGPMGIDRFGRGGMDDPVVSRMSTVDDSLEAGLFVGYSNTFDGNPRHRMNIHLDVTQDVSNNHDGLVASLVGLYWRPVAIPFDIGFRGSVTYANNNYMSSFFDVSANDSANSGLPQFDADAGIKDAAVSLMGLLHLSKSWHIGGGIQYKRLIGDAADSPIVDQRGNANQILFGLALLFSW